jgi:cytochrome P450
VCVCVCVSPTARYLNGVVDVDVTVAVDVS